jgi:hypothetical protein
MRYQLLPHLANRFCKIIEEARAYDRSIKYFAPESPGQASNFNLKGAKHRRAHASAEYK